MRAATVMTRQSGSGESRLAAYHVLDGTRDVSRDELRRFLSDRLPGHMMPAHFIVLDSLPLTTGGKIDRRALPDPVEAESGSMGTGERVLPRDEVEARLATIWQDLLGLREVSVTSGFFDLGGHSLLAIRMLTRVEQEFGRDLPLTSLFLGSTIADLAERLRQPLRLPRGLPW